jgi:HEAT repeat protein
LLDNDETLALPEVKNLMNDKNWAMRAAALEMLAHVESREAVSLLREALQRETDNRVKRAAIRALAQRDEPEAREALRGVLQD